MTSEEIFQAIVQKRGIKNLDDFLHPKYEKQHSSKQLPDITKAVARIKKAHKLKQKVVIYGDYDIDGLTATTVLLEAFEKFGIIADFYMPDRFAEGYGLSKVGIDVISKMGGQLIVTVDCGSRSLEEIDYANSLGIDVVVTDHHELGDVLPNAVAVVNPKRVDSKYPWRDLAGVGVAFKLVLALQNELDGLDAGQEKWLLDLVALGTVCDVVDLVDENRIFVWWGLKVLAKTRRPGIKALATVSGVELDNVSAEDLGYRFGPRLNASGRLEHAKRSLELLIAKTDEEAMVIAQELNVLNQQRRDDQQKIFEEACALVAEFKNDDVLVLANENWSHGINGIVASKLVEKYNKPVFVMQILGEKTKGSARTFGDFHLADALKSVGDLLLTGGGHKAAAGATIKTADIADFRKALNQNYKNQELKNQDEYLVPDFDIEIDIFSGITVELLKLIDQLAPFGNKNESPVFRSKGVKLDNWKPVGVTQAHAKSTFIDKNGYKIDGIGFGLAENMPSPGSKVEVVFSPQINEFNGRITVQANLLAIQ
jgi:single-stranded-DNA-specific exonuclease